MATVYPACGRHPSSVRGLHSVLTFTVGELKRIMSASAVIEVRAPDGRRILYDKDATAKRLLINRRAIAAVRAMLPDKPGVERMVLRGPVVILQANEEIVSDGQHVP